LCVCILDGIVKYSPGCFFLPINYWIIPEN
jgi:hypothetical protein